MSRLCAAEQDRIWDHYQNADKLSFAASQPRLEYLARRIATRSRVLNIGIGGGQFEQAAARRAIDLYQLDPNSEAVAAAGERSGSPDKVRVGYSQAMPYEDHQFDAVVASELLEHLTDEVLDQSLAEISRVLRPAGRLLGTVPARESLADNTVFCPHCGKWFHRWGHEQSFTVERMRELLRRRFFVERVLEKQFVFWPQLNWRGKLAAAGRLALGPLISSGKNIVYLARNDATFHAR